MILTVSTLADVLRVISAGSCLVLVVSTMYALTLTRSRDQRARMVSLASYCAVTAGSNLGALGDPMRWQLPVLAVIGVSAGAATLIFVRREWRARRDGG
jgi:hypothetical protein